MQESPLLYLKKRQISEDFTNIISNKQIAKKTWTRNHNFEEKQREKKETLQGFKTLASLRAEPTKKLCVTTKKNCKQYESSLVLFLIHLPPFVLCLHDIDPSLTVYNEVTVTIKRHNLYKLQCSYFTLPNTENLKEPRKRIP